MKRRSSFPKRMGAFLALLLVLGSGPDPAWAGSKGKKYFQEGQRLEAAGKFDQAAEQYLLALSEADRPEYHIAYRRAALQASLILTRRGRELMEAGHYEDAYHAFRRAYQFDQTNELARELARRALELAQKEGKDVSVPASSTFGSPGPPELQAGRARPEPPPEVPQEDARQDIVFRDDLKAVIAQLGRQLGLNVLFDPSVPERRISVELRNVTKAQALDALLLSNGLFFQPLGENTIIVALDQPANRNRLQQTSVQTFYLKHADPVQVQQQLAPMAGQLRAQIMLNQDLRALIVRATPENLKLFEEIIQSIDKEKPEVMIDVSIYEVARNDLIEIGNQLLYEGFFASPPQGPIRPGTLNLLGVTAGQIITEQRLALAIPTSIIRFLQTRGRSNLIDSIQVHALDGQQVTANIGRQIPIQTASIPTSFVNVAPTQPGQQPGVQQPGLLNNIFGFGYPQIEYRPVGLNVTITPTVYSDEYVKLEMEVETSGFNEGPTSLTPIFTTRKLKSVATVRTGQAAMMAAVAQKRDEQGRTSIPFLGFLPVIGRFFSIPKQTGNTTDILITVTPHILRAASIEERDRLARLAGTMQSQGASLTIERFLEHTRAARASARGVARTETSEEKKAAESAATPPTEAVAPSAPAAPVPVQGEPIPLSLQMSTATPRAGEWVQIALFLNGKEEIREATVALTYDPRLLRLVNVADGGALTSSEAPAEVRTQHDASGKLTLTVRATGSARPARGRLAVLLFDVLQSGSAQLEVDAAATRFVTADGRAVGCKASPLTIAVR
jgi:general secretion pathway protein D